MGLCCSLKSLWPQVYLRLTPSTFKVVLATVSVILTKCALTNKLLKCVLKRHWILGPYSCLTPRPFPSRLLFHCGMQLVWNNEASPSSHAPFALSVVRGYSRELLWQETRADTGSQGQRMSFDAHSLSPFPECLMTSPLLFEAQYVSYLLILISLLLRTSHFFVAYSAKYLYALPT